MGGEFIKWVSVYFPSMCILMLINLRVVARDRFHPRATIRLDNAAPFPVRQLCCCLALAHHTLWGVAFHRSNYNSYLSEIRFQSRHSREYFITLLAHPSGYVLLPQWIPWYMHPTSKVLFAQFDILEGLLLKWVWEAIELWQASLFLGQFRIGGGNRLHPSTIVVSPLAICLVAFSEVIADYLWVAFVWAVFRAD